MVRRAMVGGERDGRIYTSQVEAKDALLHRIERRLL